MFQNEPKHRKLIDLFTEPLKNLRSHTFTLVGPPPPAPPKEIKVATQFEHFFHVKLLI